MNATVPHMNYHFRNFKIYYSLESVFSHSVVLTSSVELGAQGAQLP